MVKAVLYAKMDKYSIRAKKHVNVLSPPFSMDILVLKWMPALMVKYGMYLNIHVNVQISHGGMDMNASLSPNAKEGKHLIAYINASALMAMYGVQTLV